MSMSNICKCFFPYKNYSQESDGQFGLAARLLCVNGRARSVAEAGMGPAFPVFGNSFYPD